MNGCVVQVTLCVCNTVLCILAVLNHYHGALPTFSVPLMPVHAVNAAAAIS